MFYRRYVVGKCPYQFPSLLANIGRPRACAHPKSHEQASIIEIFFDINHRPGHSSVSNPSRIFPSIVPDDTILCIFSCFPPFCFGTYGMRHQVFVVSFHFSEAKGLPFKNKVLEKSVSFESLTESVAFPIFDQLSPIILHLIDSCISC